MCLFGAPLYIIQGLPRYPQVPDETLNDRKQHFNYGSSEIGNLSGPIKILNSKKLSIKMSAREMQTFIHFFPLIIGDMVPENNEVWLFLLNFVEITDLILLLEFDDNDIIKLEKCIAYHNTKYVQLFNDCLKPKHHFLTHYCNIIKQSGPLKCLWTYSFESKHRELKSYTKNIHSGINTPLHLEIISFRKHFASYKINASANNTNYILRNINEFNSSPIHIYTLPSNETVVRR
ncbi:hypothetical protein AGLY_018104 [Aphis glycines]|uniref:Uncharacterized protein n=1 Tax=Aphis glycines TaxID=307491 RepID=A0A6G0STT3_APHGL|nr:hypothetical protein AGLY_018104 [Aphis glycines]